MYTVLYKTELNQIQITCTTLDALRDVGTARIEKLAVWMGGDSYRTIRLLRSDPKDIGRPSLELIVSPAIIWKDVEEFINHSLIDHTKRLQKLNLQPLTPTVKYQILGKDRGLRDSTLFGLSMLLDDLGVLKATTN